MNSASKYANLTANPHNEVDTNLFFLSFNNLREAEKSIATGDPFFCKNCRAILFVKSQIYTLQEIINVDEELKFPSPLKPKLLENDALPMEEFKIELRAIQSPKKNKKEMDGSPKTPEMLKIKRPRKIKLDYSKYKGNTRSRFWVCDFCEEINEINLDDEELPKNQDLIYLIQSKNIKAVKINLIQANINKEGFRIQVRRTFQWYSVWITVEVCLQVSLWRRIATATQLSRMKN